MNKRLMLTLLVGVMAMTLVSAVLVGYLSNTVTADVEVKSPIVQGISDSETGSWSETLPLDDMYTGGEKTFTFYVKTENVAGESVTGDVENIVTNWKGVTCDDFESVKVSTDSGTGYGPEYDLIDLGFCSIVDDYHVKFSYGPTPITWIESQVDITEIVVTFNDVIGKYTFTSQVVPTA